MKSRILLVLASFIFVLVASSVQAGVCDYHQWPPLKRCKEKPQKLVLAGINFDTGSATIKKDSYPILDSNVDMLKKHSGKGILVVGYTDNVGNPASNQKLSEKRAESVKNYFISKGVDASRISAVGKGEADPIASNTTATGRAENRRIEVEFK
ncbi:MAG: OmpA family protein [Pseudomonadota bacterium]